MVGLWRQKGAKHGPDLGFRLCWSGGRWRASPEMGPPWEMRAPWPSGTPAGAPAVACQTPGWNQISHLGTLIHLSVVFLSHRNSIQYKKREGPLWDGLFRSG